MFKGLMLNEFIKIFSKLKTYVILLLFLALSIMIGYMGHVEEQYFLDYVDPAQRVENLENQLQFHNEDIKQMATMEGWSDAEKENEIKRVEAYIAQTKEELLQAKKDMAENATYDWVKDANRQLTQTKEQLLTTENPEDRAFLEQEITRLTYHLDNDISIAESNLNTGLNYLNTSLMVILTGFMAFGLILFNADIISGEYNPGTLKFLLIQPVTRIKVLLAKYLSTVMSSLGLIVGIQLLFTLGIGLINGFGSPNLPMMMGERYKEVFEEGYRVLRVIPGSGSMVDYSEYLLKGLLLEILFIFAMVAFILMVSVISKSTVMAFTVLIGTLLGTNIVYSLSATYRKLSPLIFLHHADVNGILSGQIIRETGILSFTYPLSLIVLTLSTLVFLGISMVIFKKRDILI